MDERLRELLFEAIFARHPFPPHLEAIIREEFRAAGGDADAATARLRARMDEGPALEKACALRTIMVEAVGTMLDLGWEYDPTTDRWRRPPADQEHGGTP